MAVVVVSLWWFRCGGRGGFVVVDGGGLVVAVGGGFVVAVRGGFVVAVVVVSL